MNKEHILLALSNAARDERLNAWHLAIYHALIYMFTQSKRDGPFSISRKKVMKLARIRAAPTYHKYIIELQKMGYILYIPSYHPKKGSTVVLLSAI